VESPSMAEVGPPVILSLGVAGYCSVRRTSRAALVVQWVEIYADRSNENCCP
jgi:hypothetical protein